MCLFGTRFRLGHLLTEVRVCKGIVTMTPHVHHSVAAYLRAHLRQYFPSGPGYAMAQCPFHADSSPSLSVTVATGSFRCFGCSAKGDLAHLIVKLEGGTIGAAVVKAHKLRQGASHD